MKFVQLKNTVIGRFELFESFHEITHFISTRVGGFSSGDFASLNLGYGTDDDAETVTRNRLLLAEDLGIPLDWFVFPRQTHSNHVYRVTNADRGRGSLDRETAIPDTDALVTNARHTCIVVQVADCVPVLLFAPDQRVIAVIHAGWRGTASRIVSETVRNMQVNYGCKPAEIFAAIGPSIQQCCYQVGDDVYEAFAHWNGDRQQIFHRHHSMLMLDLPMANRLLLLNEGVNPENIVMAPHCTKCTPEYFYSSRFSHGNTGRFVVGMMLW
ncbi:MAG: peptidoglycan editing factor PgeF [Bacteroidales bacterium]